MINLCFTGVDSNSIAARPGRCPIHATVAACVVVGGFDPTQPVPQKWLRERRNFTLLDFDVHQACPKVGQIQNFSARYSTEKGAERIDKSILQMTFHKIFFLF